MTNAEKKEKADELRRAELALRLLAGVPDGTPGKLYQVKGGWLLSYGEEWEVMLPPLENEVVFCLVNDGSGLPLAPLDFSRRPL